MNLHRMWQPLKRLATMEDARGGCGNHLKDQLQWNMHKGEGGEEKEGRLEKSYFYLLV